MPNEGIPINPAIVEWARKRSGLSLDDAAEKFRHIAAWESGELLPSYPQLEKLADELKVPIAVFFFPEPPKVPPIRESFRTLPDTEYERIPREVLFMLRKAKALQLNLADLTNSRNPAPRLITRDLQFRDTVTPEAMAARVRDYLGIPLEVQFSWSDTEIALKAWRKAIQDLGIFVFKDAFYSENYCGFSLYDEVLPIIYVNNSVPKTRQIFTLLHELAHILFRTSGIDTLREPSTRRMDEHQKRIEVLCNRFAAQFLVPDAAFADAMRGQDRSVETVETLAERFSVSREVIFRKFLDRGWVTQAAYNAAVDEWNGQRQRGKPGGNHYYTKLTYLGREYVGLALQQYHQNRIDEVQLADYLDTKPKNVATLEEYYLAGHA